MTYLRNNEIIHKLPQKMKKRTMLYLVHKARKILISKLAKDISSKEKLWSNSPPEHRHKNPSQNIANQTHQYTRISNYDQVESYIPLYQGNK